MGVPTTEMAPNGVKHANGQPTSMAAKYDLAEHFIGLNHVGVAPPSKVKDFVTAHGGHTVITNVSSARDGRNWGTADGSNRFSLPTTVSQRSRRSARCGSGLTRRLAMRRRFNSRSWPRQKIYRQTPTTFEWQTSMSRFVNTFWTPETAQSDFCAGSRRN
jgi:hypothetical protein